MRKVLIAIPAMPLFFFLIAGAVSLFVWETLRKKRQPDEPRSATPLYMLGGAWLLMGIKGGGFAPSAALFRGAWDSWGTVPIYAYGVMLGTAFIVGWFITMRFSKEDGVPQNEAANIFMWTAVYSIVGARILYVIVNRHEMDDWKDPFMIQRGGLVAYGGMIGGFLASWYGCWRRNIPLLRWADITAPGVVIGTAITRVGCFLYGCDYGRRTEVPWAVSFPPDAAAFEHHLRSYGLDPHAPGSFPVHPTQLYELVAMVGLFGLMLWLRRNRRFSGQVFLGWVIGYGIIRPIVESLRDDTQRGNVGPFSTSQFIGFVTTLLGGALLIQLLRRYRQDPTAVRLWEQPLHLAGSDEPPQADARKPRRRKRG